MLGHPREHQKSENDPHAAWERFRKMQNERRAAWERVFCPHGPDWSPQKGPKKTSETICFKLFRTFCGALNGAAELCTAKNGTAQVGAQECP